MILIMFIKNEHLKLIQKQYPNYNLYDLIIGILKREYFDMNYIKIIINNNFNYYF